MVQFTQQQHEIIDNFGVGQAVVAGAGCGKTTTLVAKCLALLKQNPKARFCAVSFTEKSVRDLKEALAKGLHQAGVRHHEHWVKTIHGLCATIIQEFPTPAGLQGGERILLEDESTRLWERSVNTLWSANESEEIGDAVVELLKIYNKHNLEILLFKLKNLLSFGVEEWIQKSIQGPFARDDIKNLWICFESVHRRYVHAKTRMGAMDFNDLEVFALKALEQDWVRKHFQKMFDLVLVDEFQDTNPVQGKILERFARPGLTNLCIVGDPKQSIYRFRDADVSVFFDLTERLARKHLLTENYRSRPSIIHFVNQVCAPVFEASALTYEPLTPGREEIGASKTANVWLLAIKSEQDLANYLKSQMDQGIDLSEFAILSRSLKGKAQKFLQSMNQAGVPFILGSGGAFYADPRVQELVAFLKGFCSAGHRLSQWTALRSPWIAVDEHTLLSWKENYYDYFFKSDHPIAQALKEFYQSAQSVVRPGQILERLFELMSDSNSELFAEMSLSVLSLWHKAESFSAQGLRFEEVVQSFVSAIESGKLEKEIPPPAQAGAVRVMTIHGSKGLQFPRVILLDFDGPNRSGRGFKDLIWDRKRGVHLFHRESDGGKNKENDENLFWEDLEKRNAIAESKRLFYVAITRPQEELILVWPEREPTPAESKADPLKTDHWRAWVETTALPSSKEVASSGVSSTIKTHHPQLPPFQKVSNKIALKFVRFRPRHSPSEWRILEQCKLHYYWKWIEPKSVTPEEVENDLEKIKKEKWKEIASEKGGRVHALLEVEDWEGLKKLFKRESSEALVETLMAHLNASSDTQIYREFGFEVPLNADEALVGMMDRLEVDEKARSIRVIDYKWTEGEKSPEALLKDYQLQLQLYAWAASQMVSFEPKSIEAIILHLNPKGVQKISLPQNALKADEIYKTVNRLHSQTSQQESRGESDWAANVGDYCRYCEFRSQCSAFKMLSNCS